VGYPRLIEVHEANLTQVVSIAPEHPMRAHELNNAPDNRLLGIRHRQFDLLGLYISKGTPYY
jgi:hypothetical protein